MPRRLINDMKPPQGILQHGMCLHGAHCSTRFAMHCCKLLSSRQFCCLCMCLCSACDMSRFCSACSCPCRPNMLNLACQCRKSTTQLQNCVVHAPFPPMNSSYHYTGHVPNNVERSGNEPECGCQHACCTPNRAHEKKSACMGIDKTNGDQVAPSTGAACKRRRPVRGRLHAGVLNLNCWPGWIGGIEGIT